MAMEDDLGTHLHHMTGGESTLGDHIQTMFAGSDACMLEMGTTR